MKSMEMNKCKQLRILYLTLKGLIPREADDNPVQYIFAECDLSHNYQTVTMPRCEIVLQKEILGRVDVCKLLDYVNSLPDRRLLSL